MTEEFEDRIRGLKGMLNRVQKPPVRLQVEEPPTNAGEQALTCRAGREKQRTLVGGETIRGRWRMKKLLFCLALAGAIGVAYYNALGNDFVFDDYLLVVDSP